MTDVIVSNVDVIVEVQQPTIPPAAPPPKIGLVEINQVVARGTAWMTGNGPPTAAGGQYGDMYLDATTGDMYQWDGTAWQYIGTFAPSTDTPAEVLAKIVTVDGAGSGLDADLLDGHDSPYFATQTDMTAVQAKNTSQDTQISGNTTNIATNANAIADLQTATTPANLLTSIKTVDGSGSGLDADTLDGHDTAYFGTAAADTTLQNNINLKANIASPVFTGDPQAPTPATADNDTSIATTAFVKSVTATIVPFPEAPQDGLTYGRKNATWSTVIGGAATSDTPPPGPLVSGQLWWKSDTGTFYVYYQDVNSSQWVQAAAPAVPAGLPLILSLFAGGTLATNEVLFRYEFAVAGTIPAGLSSSQGSSGIAATGNPVLSIRKNNTQFGTATFTGTQPVFAAASATAFAIGDVLSVVAPATVDATLADVTLSIVATLGG
jgi:hypothetical protein